jgi:ABC-type microcin C transport system duplicated ATPase subunit YejF
MVTPVLAVNHLSVNFHQDQRVTHAVQDVSFDLMPGETLCVVSAAR